jgi:hypothetical protein
MKAKKKDSKRKSKKTRQGGKPPIPAGDILRGLPAMAITPLHPNYGMAIYWTLRHISGQIAANAIAKGFRPKKTKMDAGRAAMFATNLHGEVSEWWEAFRNGKLDKPCDKAEGMARLGLPVLTAFEEEMADVIIRALDTLEAGGYDPQRAIVVKHLYNLSRPHLHGGKKA